MHYSSPDCGIFPPDVVYITKSFWTILIILTSQKGFDILFHPVPRLITNQPKYEYFCWSFPAAALTPVSQHSSKISHSHICHVKYLSPIADKTSTHSPRVAAEVTPETFNRKVKQLSNSTPTYKPYSTSVGWLCFPTEGRKKEERRRRNPHLASNRMTLHVWTLMVSGGFLEIVWRVSGLCLPSVRWLSGGCLRRYLKGFLRVSMGCPNGYLVSQDSTSQDRSS